MNRIRKFLRIAAWILLPVALVAWAVTLVRWYQESKSFEPINTVVSIVISGLWVFAFGGSKLHSHQSLQATTPSPPKDRLTSHFNESETESPQERSQALLRPEIANNLEMPIQVAFRDGVVADVELSATCQVPAARAPYLIEMFGDYEHAKANLISIIESCSRSVLERTTFNEFRESRRELEKAIVEMVQPDAKRAEFTVHAIRLGKISRTAVLVPEGGILTGTIKIATPAGATFDVYYKRRFKRNPHLEIQREFLSGVCQIISQRTDGFRIVSNDGMPLHLNWKAEGEFENN